MAHKSFPVCFYGKKTIKVHLSTKRCNMPTGTLFYGNIIHHDQVIQLYGVGGMIKNEF